MYIDTHRGRRPRRRRGGARRGPGASLSFRGPRGDPGSIARYPVEGVCLYGCSLSPATTTITTTGDHGATAAARWLSIPTAAPSPLGVDGDGGGSIADASAIPTARTRPARAVSAANYGCFEFRVYLCAYVLWEGCCEDFL